MATRMRSSFSNPIDADRVERIAQFFEIESRGTEATAADYASDLTDTYSKYYHHAFPFDPQVVLNVWSRCREAPKSREECERIYRANQDQMLINDVAFDRDSASLLEQCESVRTVGFQCQKGLDNAQEMLE